MISNACVLASSSVASSCMRSGSAMLSPIVIAGLSAAWGSWKMICMDRRIGRRSDSFMCVMSTPSNTMRPSDGSTRRRIVRPRVVFPQPLSPTTPKISPGLKENETSSTACTTGGSRTRTRWTAGIFTGKYLTSPSTWRIGSVTGSPFRSGTVRSGRGGTPPTPGPSSGTRPGHTGSAGGTGSRAGA